MVAAGGVLLSAESVVMIDDDPALSLCILFFTAMESRLPVSPRSDFGTGDDGSAVSDGASNATEGWGNSTVEILPLFESLSGSAHTFAKHSDRREIDESGGMVTGCAFARAVLSEEGDVTSLVSTMWLSNTSKSSSNKSMLYCLAGYYICARSFVGH